MAVVEGLVRFCDRDDRRAVTSKRFSFDGRLFQLDVCIAHLEMLHRDMTTWSRRAVHSDQSASSRSGPSNLGSVRTCCLDDDEATARMRLGYDDKMFLADLCAAHRKRFVSDMLDWAHYGEELTMSPADIAVPQRTRIQPTVDLRDRRDRRELVPGSRVEPVVPQAREVIRDETDTVIPVEVPDLTGITPSTMQEWTFTHRAHRDMDERAVTVADVWRVLDSHGKQVRPGRDPYVQVWEWKGLAVVVEPRVKKVITVMVYRQRDSRRLALAAGGI